ncbi:MAG: hypothetical protein DI622_06915 [Chryseobacterium sp.]|nr:MAG: hypothetical protein DI622_06915 [Chryseobacterium sp.]
MNDLVSCFDAPLHYNFFTASKEGKYYDLSQILKGSFLEKKPVFSVSFVENHDTQQLQALESSVQNWFKPIAYTIILLSEEAYPCVFYPDLFGAEYTDMKDGEEINVVIPKVEILPKLLQARRYFAYGEQVNYFDHPNCIAWVRRGIPDNPGCVVILSNSEDGYKEIDLGTQDPNTIYIDFLEQRKEQVKTDETGKAVFYVNPASVSVWIKKSN